MSDSHSSRSDEMERHRHAVQLATQILATATRARTSCVLITSAERNAGKTALSERMRLGLVSAGFQRHVVLRWNELAHVDPHSIPNGSMVFIDGPPLSEGVDILSVPHTWRARIDGAVVVIMKRRTRRDQLVETIAWLQASGWPPIGLVWNLHAFPRWRMFRRLFRQISLAWRTPNRVAGSPGHPTTPPAVGLPEVTSNPLFTAADMGGRIIQAVSAPLPDDPELRTDTGDVGDLGPEVPSEKSS